jgi:hypothetical protein
MTKEKSEFDDKVKLTKDFFKKTMELMDKQSISNDSLKTMCIDKLTQSLNNVNVRKKILKKLKCLIIEIENKKIIDKIKNVNLLKKFMNGK